jgi:uncharacterized LabA/DUF88 family protein
LSIEFFQKIDQSELSGSKRIKVRFYGGWYENNQFTTKAQNLSTDISSSFPNTILLSDNKTKIIVDCELAYSILADPNNHLFHTYRRRGFPLGIHAKTKDEINCSDPNCPIEIVIDFVNNNICKQCKIVKPYDVFYKAEQKLIDTMLTSDMIHASIQHSIIVIVSSDDDFWPGIKTSLMHGLRILHIHTRNRMTPSFYSKTTINNYVQKIM